jgi:hypothetical protein
MKITNMMESIGRAVIICLIAFAVNRTDWYQNLPFQTLQNTEPIVWSFCILLVLSFFWVGLPLLQELKK